MELLLGLIGGAVVMGGFAAALYFWTSQLKTDENIEDSASRVLFDDDPYDAAVPVATVAEAENNVAAVEPVRTTPLRISEGGSHHPDDNGKPAPDADPGTESPLAPSPILGRIVADLRGLLPAQVFRGRGLLLSASVLIIGWLSAGIYVVQPDEQGVVLRFGRLVDTEDPGLHYHLPYPIDTVFLPHITQVNQLQIGTAADPTLDPSGTGPSRQMLTGDENIVEAEFVVFWKLKDVRAYLFRNADQDEMLRTAAQSILHEIIARYPIQAALSDKRQQIADEAEVALQTLLDSYGAGVLITQVQLQRVDPPAAVLDAFNDVQRALADKERERNEAEAYSNDILPRARGQAKHIIEEAEAYKAQVVDLAEGDLSGFLSAYKVYRQAPDVISWRLYLDSMDALLAKTSRVIIDTSGKGVGPVMPYLPMTDTAAPSSTLGAAKP